MGKIAKYLIYGILGLVSIIVIAAVAAVMLIDPNDYKGQIATAVKKQTGRDLAIEGDLELSLFPWIGLRTGKLVLGNAPGFGKEPFAAIEEADIKVKLLPLLSKKVEIKHVVLKGLALNLEKNPQGNTNWEDLSKAQAAEPSPTPEPAEAPTEPAMPALALGGVTLEDATVVWNDRQAGKKITIEHLNSRLERLRFDQPTDFSLGFVLTMDEPPIKETLSLTTDLVIAENLKQFELKDLQLQSHSEGQSLPGGRLDALLNASVALNVEQQTLAIPALKLKVAEAQLSGNLNGKSIIDNPQISGSLKASANPRETLARLAIDLPPTQDPNVLEQTELSFDLVAGKNAVILKNLQLTLDQSKINGSLDVRSFANPIIAFNLDMDGIDVDRYLPPATKTTQADAKTERLANPPAPENAELPLAAIAALNLDGQIRIGRLKVKGLTMEQVSLKAQGRNRLMTLTPAIAKLYQGSSTGLIKIDARNPTPSLSISEQLVNVQVEHLLKDLTGKDYLSGTTQLNANLSSRGKDVPAVKRNLNGILKFLVKDGSLNNVDVLKLIKQGEAWWEGKAAPSEKQIEKFTFVGLTFLATINNGVVNTDQFLVEGRKLKLEGSGNIDLVKEQLDYQLRAVRLKHETGESGKETALAKGMPIIINISGPLDKPKYMLDLVQMAYLKKKEKIEKVKGKLEEKVTKKLEKKLGKELGGEVGEKLKKGAGGVLKGLFGQ